MLEQEVVRPDAKLQQQEQTLKDLQKQKGQVTRRRCRQLQQRMQTDPKRRAGPQGMLQAAGLLKRQNRKVMNTNIHQHTNTHFCRRRLRMKRNTHMNTYALVEGVKTDTHPCTKIKMLI